MEGKTTMRVLLLIFFISSSISSISSSTTTESTPRDDFEYEEEIGGAFEIQGDANQKVPAIKDEKLAGAKDIQSEATTEASAVITPLMTGGNPQIPTEGAVTSMNRTDKEEFAHEVYLMLKPIRKAAVGFFLLCVSIVVLLIVYCIILVCRLRKTGKDELRMAEEGHADVTQDNKEATGNQGCCEHCLQSFCAACTTYLVGFLLKR